MQLNGAVVLVTGGSRGIGEAMARSFAKAGAKVVVVARSGDHIERIANAIGGVALQADLLDSGQVDGLIERVEAKVGPVDVLVNNAGLETSCGFLSLDDQRIRDVARLNFEAPLVLTRHVLPGMVKRGRGHIVMTSSLGGTSGFPGLAVYSGTKSGLNNFTSALRLELKDTPIKTTLVAPGPVDTELWAHLEQGPYMASMLKRLRLLQLIPMFTPEKIGKLTVKAVAADKRHVRVPRRLLLTFWLGEAPRRITEAILAGVHFDVPQD